MEDRIELDGVQAGSGPLASLKEYFRGVVREALEAVVEEEVARLCGPSHRPDADAPCRRAGNAPSRIFLDGRVERLKRPRVRTKAAEGSREVELESWRAARDPRDWEDAVMRAVLCGVSSRKVALLDSGEAGGLSRSAVSRLFARKASEVAAELQEEDLSGFDLLILQVDAVVLSRDTVATVALGIDREGRKKVLGFRVGSSESLEVCLDLLESLARRGLRRAPGRALLAILDGSEALRRAVERSFPGVLVQRCLVHKERNLRAYLSKRHWPELGRLFAALRRAQGLEQAAEAVGSLREFLRSKNAQARESLEEAGEDLLRFFGLEVPNTLNPSLLSTNCIENAFRNLRGHLGRVCRWRESTAQADRWMATGLKLAEAGFRGIRGVEDLPLLVAALERRDAAGKAA
jgi:putative transposase